MKHPRLLLLLCITFLIPPLAGGTEYGVQISADISGAAVFLDNSYIGDTPVTLPLLKEGVYRVAATAPGYPAQEKNITISPEEHAPVFFSFGPRVTEPEPGEIKNYDCALEPERTGIRGTSISTVTLPGGEIMAYYSGRGEAVQCAGSTDGSRWYEYPDGCLQVPEDDVRLSLSGPWVYQAREGGYGMMYLSGDKTGHSLFHAYSADGKRFTPDGEVTMQLLSESNSTLPEQKSVPTGVRLEDGDLRMYYSVQGGGIKSAISADDGKTWTEEDGYRLESATDPSVIRLPDGGYGIFYVDLSTGSQGQKIGVAASTDGLVFTRSESGGIIESDQKGVWILDPDMYVRPDGKWMLFFSVMGTPGGAGIAVPTVMKSTIDPACLMTLFNQTAR